MSENDSQRDISLGRFRSRVPFRGTRSLGESDSQRLQSLGRFRSRVAFREPPRLQLSAKKALNTPGLEPPEREL